MSTLPKETKPEDITINGETWLSCTCGHHFVIDGILERVKAQSRQEAREQALKDALGVLNSQEVVMTVNRVGLDCKRTENKLISKDQATTAIESLLPDETK